MRSFSSEHTVQVLSCDSNHKAFGAGNFRVLLAAESKESAGGSRSLGDGQDSHRLRTGSLRLGHDFDSLHFVPVVGKLLAAIQADHVGACDRRRRSTTELASYRNRKAATFVPTPEEHVEHAHDLPPQRSKRRALTPLVDSAFHRSNRGSNGCVGSILGRYCLIIDILGDAGARLIQPIVWQLPVT